VQRPSASIRFPRLHGDLMTVPTYQDVAEMQRVMHIAANPQELARQISAEQFRPTEKAEHGTIERETSEHSGN
jgi:hypothetical protein